MIQTASTIAQVGVDRLPALYSSLTAALSEAGISDGQLGEILSKYVSAECVLCGTRVSGEEIRGITSAAEESLAPGSKFDRLKRGSCVKIGCISCYYRVHLREHPGLDWTTIRERASEDEAFKEAKAARKRSLIRVVLGVGVILILLLCRYVMYFGHLPLLQKPHKYTVDPASVAPEAPH
jgi:hypothetical protein